MTRQKPPVKKAAPKKASPLQAVPDETSAEELTIEQRLAIVEQKVDFIYNHIVQQASLQMQGQIQEEIKNRLMEGVLNGPGTGNNPQA